MAREHGIGVKLYSLSLNARGTGAVGEMTRLISSAFDEVRSVARHSRVVGSGVRASVILLIDEADALAQSREFAQMHHEDRAGVNALIRGIDSLSTDALPVLVVMCTNRLDAIDPAIQRRAAAIFDFPRPNELQRRTVLRAALEGTGFSDSEIAALVQATGPVNGRSYGYTYSDLTQRLLPTLLLDAFPEHPIRLDRVLELARVIRPTPPFRGEAP